MAIKRGTNVEFVGTRAGESNSVMSDMWFKQQVKYYDAKHGVKLGDKGTVVRTKNGWFRVSWTRQDGTRVVSIPMRADHFTEKPAEKPEADGESSPVRPTSLLYGFEPDGESSPVQPPMNENFGFDEQPTPDAVVADMKKEAEKVRNRPATPVSDLATGRGGRGRDAG